MPKLSANRDFKDYLKFIGPGTAITIVGFIIAYEFVAPAPPRHIRMVTGSSDGAYYFFGGKYSEILSEYGIRLELIKTAGSPDNLKLPVKTRAMSTWPLCKAASNSLTNPPDSFHFLPENSMPRFL